MQAQLHLATQSPATQQVEAPSQLIRRPQSLPQSLLLPVAVLQLLLRLPLALFHRKPVLWPLPLHLAILKEDRPLPLLVLLQLLQ